MEQIKIRDLSLWEAFYWVCKKSSFTSAAEQLRMNVPFLSKKIGKLEESLGVRLFNRTTRRVSMTQEAQNLLPRVETLLEEAGGLERAHPSLDEAGLIRLTCVPSFAYSCLSRMLVKFREKHPAVFFDLHVSEQLIDLVDSQMDVAIRVQTPKGAQFVFRKLLVNELIWCASPKYLKAHPPLKKAEDLKQHDLLVLPVYEDCGMPKGRVRDYLKNQPLRCGSGAVLTELTLQGGGIALRSRWDVMPLIRAGKLEEVLEKETVEPFGELFAVTPHNRLLTRRVRLFLDFLSQECRSLEG